MSSQWGPAREPPSNEPGQVDPQWWLRPGDVVAVVAAYGQTRLRLTDTLDRLGPHPPLTPAELAAHVHDLADARGQDPTLNANNRAEAEVAAAHLLAVLRVPAP